MALLKGKHHREHHSSGVFVRRFFSSLSAPAGRSSVQKTTTEPSQAINLSDYNIAALDFALFVFIFFFGEGKKHFSADSSDLSTAHVLAFNYLSKITFGWGTSVNFFNCFWADGDVSWEECGQSALNGMMGEALVASLTYCIIFLSFLLARKTFAQRKLLPFHSNSMASRTSLGKWRGRRRSGLAR